jgi:hypothetical protein
MNEAVFLPTGLRASSCPKKILPCIPAQQSLNHLYGYFKVQTKGTSHQKEMPLASLFFFPFFSEKAPIQEGIYRNIYGSLNTIRKEMDFLFCDIVIQTKPGCQDDKQYDIKILP